MNHQGLAIWYNVALVTFAVVALSMTWTIMSTGFVASNTEKKVIEKTIEHVTASLKVVGKVTGTPNINDGKLKLTITPITTAATGSVDVSPDNIRIAYKIIKLGSHEITYDNIYAGILNGKYSSAKDAIEKAYSIGLINVNPYDESQKPDRTTALLYWVVDQNNNSFLDENEIANLAIIYSEKDRPAATEFIKLEAIHGTDTLLSIERTIPNVSSTVVDLGGKIH